MLVYAFIKNIIRRRRVSIQFQSEPQTILH